MPEGKGKYDALCTYVREQAKAVGAAVIIVKGEKGSGFSVQAPASLGLALPQMLRMMADEMEKANGRN